MGSILRRLFSLEKGEERKASLFALLGFLWSIGAYGCLTLSEGMFIEHVGSDKLPIAFLASALALCLLSSILLFAVARLTIQRFLASVILGACALLAFFAFALFAFPSPTSPLFWTLFRATGWVLPVSSSMAFWAFVDQYYDLRSAKRLFCFFSSLIFLGDSVAGFSISLWIEKIGLMPLLFLFLLTMLSSLPVLFYITKTLTPVSRTPLFRTHAPLKTTLPTLARTILASPFTAILLLLYFVMQLLTITTEYNYFTAFDHLFKGREEGALTEFLGTLACYVSLGNMLFGFFFYSRLVKKMGINNIILLSPFFFFVLFTAWLGAPVGLLIATLGFIGREGMIYSLDDNNLNLLLTGVPTQVKNNIRIAVESFFEPLAMLLAVGLLFAFGEHGRMLGLVLASTACLFVLLLRKYYAGAIFKSLADGHFTSDDCAREWINSCSQKEKEEVERLLLGRSGNQ